MTEWYTIAETAARLHVRHTTVKRWITEGKLKALKLPSGHLRISSDGIVSMFGKQQKKEENGTDERTTEEQRETDKAEGGGSEDDTRTVEDDWAKVEAELRQGFEGGGEGKG